MTIDISNVTVSEVFEGFEDTRKETIYALIGDALENNHVNRNLYLKALYGLAEFQKDVVDFLIKEALNCAKS